ncbi:MAG TPA: indole-3-glycerol-phosphate synthase [Syntrophomonas sp.]|nr:indole-3-glycerol-phosphate synthase [Syntrophomonas sp.]
MNGFSQSLRQKRKAGFIPVIPDIKLRSPKEGELFKGRDPVAAARLMAQLGAPALSVVTEVRDFGGSLKLLEQVANAVNVPVLRKDFINTVDDLHRTKECGAAAVLLIAARLDGDNLAKLYNQARKLSLEPLVEAHTRAELALAVSLEADLIGINNRDIINLERDEGSVSHTQALAAWVPKDVLLISESGIKTPEQARTATLAGAGAVLVGTAIWQASDPGQFYLSMCQGETSHEPNQT